MFKLLNFLTSKKNYYLKKNTQVENQQIHTANSAPFSSNAFLNFSNVSFFSARCMMNSAKQKNLKLINFEIKQFQMYRTTDT